MRKFYFLPFVVLLFTSLISKAQVGTNLSYDGVDDYVAIPSNASSSIVSGLTGDFTIEAWVYWRGGASLAYQRILDFGNDQNNYVFLVPYSTIPSNGARFAITIGGTPQVIDASAPLTQNTWNHIAVTVDDATSTGTIFINGVNVGSTGPGVFTYRPATLGVTTNNWLGKSEYPDPFFNGDIEELRISNVVRYPSTGFTPSTSQFLSDGNTVALYHFNEGTGQTTADATGINPDGILGGTLASEPSDPTWIYGSVLPVRLGDFNVVANSEKKSVDLRWTVSVDNASSFVIERSSNGTNFTPVTTISQAASTRGLASFSFRDDHPLSGRSFYRLKLAETGSAPFYSKIVPVNLASKDYLLVYPNPLHGSLLHFELTQPFTGEVEVSLTNDAGAVIFRQKTKVANTREFQINRNSIPSGNYLLQVTAGGLKQSQMVLMQ
ncbi:MAG: LamG-like jellyroll fold domain-containing protein [Flavisolibacter sp.]